MTIRQLPGGESIDVLVWHRAALLREVGGTSLRQRDYLRWLMDAAASGDCLHWVAEQDDRIVASVGVTRWSWAPSDMPGARSAFIYGLYVEPTVRRQGIARDLLRTVHAWAAADHLDSLTVLESPIAGDLYPRGGYRPVARAVLGRLLLIGVWLLWSRRLVYTSIHKET